MLVGKATRVSQYLISLDKEYEGTIELGKTTDSQDADGQVMETRPVPALTEAEVRAAMQGFLGDQYQTPPMFSAIKIDGVPLYKRARRGEDVEREPRFIRVMSWDLLALRVAADRLPAALHQGDLRADAGARPRERSSGCGAHLCALRRTATDRFNVSQALTLEQIEALSHPRDREEADSGQPGGPERRPMSLPAQFDGLDRVALPGRPLHVAIGIFDGVHLGHRAVIEAAVQSARLQRGRLRRPHVLPASERPASAPRTRPG